MPEERFTIAERYWKDSETADDAAGRAVTREELALTGPLALGEADPDACGPAQPGAGAASRRGEIARVASAIVVAGLVGWAAYGPIHGAAKSVRDSVPGQPATGLPSPSRPVPLPGRGGWSTPDEADRVAGGGSGGGGGPSAIPGMAPVAPSATPGPRSAGAGGSPPSSRSPARTPTTAPPSTRPPTTPASPPSPQPSSASPTATPSPSPTGSPPATSPPPTLVTPVPSPTLPTLPVPRLP